MNVPLTTKHLLVIPLTNSNVGSSPPTYFFICLFPEFSFQVRKASKKLEPWLQEFARSRRISLVKGTDEAEEVVQ